MHPFASPFAVELRRKITNVEDLMVLESVACFQKNEDAVCVEDGDVNDAKDAGVDADLGDAAAGGDEYDANVHFYKVGGGLEAGGSSLLLLLLVQVSDGELGIREVRPSI